MKISPRLEPPAQPVQSQTDVVAGGIDPGSSSAVVHAPAGVAATGYSFSRLFCPPKVCPAHERHVRRPTWTDLFFDLVFAAAIAQLSAPLDHDYSLTGIARFAFLLALVFLAWFGYTAFSTQFAVDDVLERVLIVGQVFLVAVMAANATNALSSSDAAGFGAAYGGVRAILALQYARVVAGGVDPGGPASPRPATALVRRRIGGLCVAVVVWVGAALLPLPYRYAGWAVALLIDFGNSWPALRTTTASPPGATHFPERFGLLTIILLGEFVASVMRGIESQMGWSFLAASAAVLSLALGFTIWSSYSDGAMGWEARHVRGHRDVVRLRAWIALHFALFLGIGVLGVGVRRAIALPPGGHFSDPEQWIICAAAAGMILVIMGIAATSERHVGSGRRSVWLSQAGIALGVLTLAPLSTQIIATGILLFLLLCFAAQIVVLIANLRL
jgi:low temperature requirement protein LtrA